MEVSAIKNLGIPVDDRLHMEIKIQATKEGKTIKEYIIELVKKDLESKKKK